MPSEGHESRRRRGAVLATLGAAALAAAAGLVTLDRRPAPPLPVYATLPPFELTAHTGRPLRSADLGGRPWIADFIFTRCAGVCPAMTSRVSRLQSQIPPGTRLVSFTVDPLHDTPEVLARYARDFHAGDTWLFVTGSKDALHTLATGGFKLEAFEVPPDQQTTGGDGPFLHSSKLVLVDGGGQVRGYYDSADEAAVRRLQDDVQRLVPDAR